MDLQAQTQFKARYGPWALITGASSGIGAEFARQLAPLGLNLVLVARRENRLQTLATNLARRWGIATRVVPLDLGHDDFLALLRNATADLEVGLLINNAGFSMTGPLLDNGLEDELQMLHVNGRAALTLAHTLGRAMRARGRGGIIFVSSVAGFAAVPLWTHYAATKAYTRYLAEGLAAELAPYDVDVMALCPGTTRTEFLQVADVDEFMALNADAVVADALQQLGRNSLVIPGFFYKLGIFATRFLPRRFNSFAFSHIVARMQKA